MQYVENASPDQHVCLHTYQSFCYPLTESMETVVYVNQQGMP